MTNPTLVKEAKERLRRYLNANSDLHEATVIDNDDQEDSPTFGDLRTLLTSLPTDDDDTVERDTLVSRAYEHCARIADCMAQDSTVEERRWAAGRIAEIIRAQAIHHPITNEAGTCATS